MGAGQAKKASQAKQENQEGEHLIRERKASRKSTSRERLFRVFRDFFEEPKSRGGLSCTAPDSRVPTPVGLLCATVAKAAGCSTCPGSAIPVLLACDLTESLENRPPKSNTW